MEIKQKSKEVFLDGLAGRIRRPLSFDFSLYDYARKNRNKSILFSRKGRTESFFTSDSKLYFTPEEYARLKKGLRLARVSGRLDSLHSRDFAKTKIYSIGQTDVLYLQIKRRYSDWRNYTLDLVQNSVQGVSAVKMWNLSVVGAVIFGMFTMTMVYRYLGASVSAKNRESKEAVAGASSEVLANLPIDGFAEEIDEEAMTKLMREYEESEREEEEKSKLAEDIRAMVKGYPIEKMVSEIAKRDRRIAALIVAIARKESSWGQRVPVFEGQDCYNYWGYRGIRDKMGTGGHTCFDSPKDAVDTVAKRIEFLVSNEKLNTPEKMVVWKCGYDCSWDNPKAVKKWITDVDHYFKQLNK